jgi:crotonobetainyl-CoA:carnitine CoA-transferase CaiB-like acyl-CoA transferase
MNPRLGAYREAGASTLEAQREVTLVKAAYGAFRCRDGRYLSVAALEDHFWKRLCAALDLAPFGGEAYGSHKTRKLVAEAINRRIAQVLEGMDADDAFELLHRHDVPVAPVVEPARLAALSQFVLRGKFEQGTVMPAVRYPVPMHGVVAGGLGGAPALGSALV